jgi:hypothetical protein
MKRSGHHAVINWLMQQSGEGTFYNDSAKKALRRPPDSAGVTYGEPAWTAYNFEDWPAQRMGRLSDKPWLRGGKVVLIMRDVYNMLASSMRRNRATKGKFTHYQDYKTRVNKWTKHARASEHYYTILYNRWFRDREYREQICNDLGEPFTDEGLDQIGTWGGGSSFSGRDFDGMAQYMDVLKRWEQFREDPEFWDALTPASHELNHKLFGFRLSPEL